MNFFLTPEEEAFQKAFLNWLKDNLPEGYGASDHISIEAWDKRATICRAFQRRLFDAGFAGINWPKEYGGRGGTLMQGIIISEILTPIMMFLGDVNIIGLELAGPTILARGSEAQKKEFIPRILKGEHIWCQGFSEPNAGSDLANVSTRATKNGDHYVINGQKVWGSMAHLADYCILLARTNPNVPKHKGLSYFLVDMKAPGIEVRPLKQITGEVEFGEIFFENTPVPSSMMVGEENQGWEIALTTLMYERICGEVGLASAFQKELDEMVEMARRIERNGHAALDDPILKQSLAQCSIDILAMRCNGYRNVTRLMKGHAPGPEGSVGKVLWSEVHQRMGELAMEIQGPYHQLIRGSRRAIDSGKWQYLFLRSKGNTIERGTTEIQLNIIGERVLGLPKDAARAMVRK